MDIQKSYMFLVEDERRMEKLGIGTAITLVSIMLMPILVGILGFAIITGYCVRLLQNVRDGLERPLPEWDRWSEDMATGFKLFVVMLVYALPILVLMIPSVLGAALTGRGDSAEMVGIPFVICGTLLNVAYGLLFALAQPAITIAFARDLEIRSGLDFRLVWDYTRRNLSSLILVVLVYIAASFVITLAGSIIGTLLCVVGLIVTIPLASLVTLLVQYHLYGQVAHQDPMGAQGYELMVPPPAPPVEPATPS